MSKQIITAIDIGSSKICTIIAATEEDREPSVIGVATVASRGIKKGVVVNIDEAINSIIQSLEAAERMAGITVPSAYISISGKHITSTNNKGVVAVSHEEITPEDVIRAIDSARTVSIPPSREILHVIPREFIVDAQTGIKDPVGMAGTRLEADTHIISATSTALHNLIKCIQQIGLKIDDVVFSGWASSMTVLTPTEKELGVLLVDIGAGTVDIATFVEDAITYSGSIPIGGANITSDIAIGLRVSIDNAEKIKLNIQKLKDNSKNEEKVEELDKKKSSSKEVEKKEKKKDKMLNLKSLNITEAEEVPEEFFDKIVEARLRETFRLIRAQLEQSGYDWKLPAGLVITGGTAMIPNITKIAQMELAIPARVGHPQGIVGLTDEVSSPGFATTQGLVVYANSNFDSGKEGSNYDVSSGKSGGGVFGKVQGFFKNLLP